MRRRRFLAALGGSASLGLGGLLSYRASRTRTLSVASVETYDAAFRLDDRRHRNPRIESTDSLEPQVARAVASAVDGGFETDDPPSRLSEFRDRTEFVRHEGVPYRLSDTFPRLVVTAEPYEGDPSNLSVASLERFHEAIGRNADVDEDAFLANAQRGGVVERDPNRRLRDFFETYDAVGVGERYYTFSATYRNAGSPYGLTAERVTEATVRDERSVDLADVARPARDRIREALGDGNDGTYGLVDPSPELVTKLRATNLLRADGAAYYVDAWPLDHLSLSISATVTEAGIGFKDPGRIALTVENTGNDLLSLYGSSPWPFGGLRYRASDGDRARHLYPLGTRSSSLWPTMGSSHGHDNDGLGSGERRRVEYAIGGDAVGVPPGTYVVDGSLGTNRDFRDASFPFRVVLEIE